MQSHHDEQLSAFIDLMLQQLQICRRSESKLAKALNEKTSVGKELQQANETIKQYKQKVLVNLTSKSILNSSHFQMEDITEKMFNETQQREWVVKTKASMEAQLKESNTLQSQLGETKELLQQERLNV